MQQEESVLSPVSTSSYTFTVSDGRLNSFIFAYGFNGLFWHLATQFSLSPSSAEHLRVTYRFYYILCTIIYFHPNYTPGDIFDCDPNACYPLPCDRAVSTWLLKYCTIQIHPFLLNISRKKQIKSSLYLLSPGPLKRDINVARIIYKAVFFTAAMVTKFKAKNPPFVLPLKLLQLES